MAKTTFNPKTNRVKEIRKKLRLTQSELARILNVSTSTVGRYEIKSPYASNPTIEIALRLIDYCTFRGIKLSLNDIYYYYEVSKNEG